MTNSDRTSTANQSLRCSHVKVNGQRCGAPARSGRNLCCFHDSAAQRNRDFFLPVVEDHASFQLAINKVLQAVLDKLLDHKTANSLLYGLQIAYANLKPLRSERHSDDFNRSQRKLAQELAASAQVTAAEAAATEDAAQAAASEGRDFSRANQLGNNDSALAAEVSTHQVEQGFSPAGTASQDAAAPPRTPPRVLTAEEAYGWKEPQRRKFEELYAQYFPERPKPPQAVRQAMQQALDEESSG